MFETICLIIIGKTQGKEITPMQAATREALLQNLKDAGCDPDIIARFMTCQDAGKTKDSLRVLSDEYREMWNDVF